MARNAIVSIILRAKDMASPVFKGIAAGAKQIKASIFSVQGAVASLGASITASVVIGFLIRVNREYAKLTTQLETFAGSRKAAMGIFQDLAKFAAETPFQITEMVRAYVQLRAAGIRPTMQTLRLLGDQAAAMGVTMDETAVAIRAAVAGEFEPMARTLGVKMLVVGNQISATFDGTTKLIGRDTKSIINFLEELSEKKFAGGMERQAKTIDGALSNLQDGVESLGRAIGDAGLTQDITNAAKALTDFVNSASGLDALRVQFESIRAVVLTIADAIRLSLHVAITPIQMVASAAAGIIQSLTGLMIGALLVPAAMIDSVTGSRFHLVDKMQKIAAGRFSAAGNSFKNIGRGVVSLGNDLGETLANASLRGDRVDNAVYNRIVNEGKGTVGGGLAATGRADAASTRFNPKAEKDAETARKKVITDMQDEAELLEQQIKLRELGWNSLNKTYELEKKLRDLMAKPTTTAGERASILRSIEGLRDARGDFVKRGQDDRDALIDVARGNFGTYIARQRASGAVPDLTTNYSGTKDMPLKQRIGSSIKDAIGDAQTLNQVIADMSTNTLQGFGNAIESAFAAWSEGSIGAARAFSSAMLGAIGEVASGLGQLFLGKTAGAIGDGLLGNPAGFAAAGKYASAAALLFGIAGVLKGKAAQISSGGGVRSGRADAERSNSNLKGSTGEATLIIEGDPVLDMSNPRTERAMTKALSNLSGRKVRVKKRNAA